MSKVIYKIGMQLARKSECSKINVNRRYRNLWLPKGCYNNNLLWAAKVRGYSTYGKDKNDGDGVSIVPKIGEVGQFNTLNESNVGDNAHNTLINNGNNLKKVNMNLYKKMFDRELYKKAYNKIKLRESSMTPRTEEETLDGFSNKRIDRIIQSMKDRSFKFKPTRRIETPKPNGKLRKIGIPSTVDKITLNVLKAILEEIYEPIFLDTSHGFRPNRGTHTALKEIKNWTGITWAIEGDIKSFFDDIDRKSVV